MKAAKMLPGARRKLSDDDSNELATHQANGNSNSKAPRGPLRLGGAGNKFIGARRNSNNHNDNDEREQFLGKDTGNEKKREADYFNHHSSSSLKDRKLAKLAREETIGEGEEDYRTGSQRRLSPENQSNCPKMVLRILRKKRVFIPLIIILFITAIYCLPFVDIQPRTTKQLPHIPFNFRDGPLRPTHPSNFRAERLFKGQVQGPESVALTATGNMYMAIEGGFILYAHLNRSSPLPRALRNQYKLAQARSSLRRSSEETTTTTANLLPEVNTPELVLVAELNGVRRLPNTQDNGPPVSWRRECQLDEQLYGRPLYSDASPNPQSSPDSEKSNKLFRSNVIISRCSKPLGIRLSANESHLYVVDTLSGLYRVNLLGGSSSSASGGSDQLVTRLLDFRSVRSVPVLQLDPPESQRPSDGESPLVKGTVNVTLKAIDDLAIDFGAGTRQSDLIYLSLSSQGWRAVSYLYDLLEGRPTGGILRFDVGANQLGLLDPKRVSHVRTSSHDLANATSRLYSPFNMSSSRPFMGIGAPQLDENDTFDDRPLHFPNGLQLTDDREALLIADTSNKRIIKHYIRGPRKGTSDLWAWTPHFPDNIRRGYDKNQETYWVVGCGQDTSQVRVDLLEWLQPWPTVRKYILKNIYLFGWIIEQFGQHLLRSPSVRDYGYSMKIGHSLCENMCPGVMILQYNSYGDIIRSIYSKEFPTDLSYYSQVNEIYDAITLEHVLYLSSPSYSYVTKLTLPTDLIDSPSAVTATAARTDIR